MKLNIALLWHLHQPYYVDPEERNFLLPWVRLHAAKNYLFLPEMFKRYPEIKQNINLVPSLLKQLEHYVDDDMSDTFLLLSKKSAYDLTTEEKEFIVSNFFHAHAETMIFRYPRYRELYERWRKASGDPARALKLFGISEITDLQVLFNLVWLNPLHYEGEENIQKLVKKGRLFGEDDKRVLLDFHREIVGRVIEGYRDILRMNIAELTVSPFYHPILPVLIDSNCVKIADPSAELPPFRIACPDDAKVQIRKGREYFNTLFGHSPAGMWPSEGSVSDRALEMMYEEGFQYTFTDELVLKKSISDGYYRESNGLPDKPEVLYQPYRYKNSNMHIFFRDHYLSDLIGFAYKKWDQESAAHHLTDKFLSIRGILLDRGHNPENYIVSLIFDGENPWEYYPNYGIDFLHALFKNLETRNELNVTTYREYFNQNEGRHFPVLDSVKPGSWIDGTFRIWFGHEEDFAAWKYVLDLKHAINNSDLDPDTVSKALEYIHIAQGSDWYWWYGDEHFTANLIEFDRLFRKNIKTAYKELRLVPPEDLEREIFSPLRLVQKIEDEGLSLKVKSLISPVIDGKETSYYEWIGSAKYSQSPIFGSMHRSGFGIVKTIHTGYDRKNFYLRIDFYEESLRENAQIGIKINLNGIILSLSIDTVFKTVTSFGGEPEISSTSSFDALFELSVPLKDLIAGESGSIQFFIIATSGSVFEERWPESLEFMIDISGEDPEHEEWII